MLSSSYERQKKEMESKIGAKEIGIQASKIFEQGRRKSNLDPKGTKKSGTKISNEQGYRNESQQLLSQSRAQERMNLNFTVIFLLH